jgi:hypothetical protein
MKLDTEFCKLPLRFDVERLVEEISVFGESEWQPHPSDYKGNTALILISSRGGQNDAFLGPMLPTPHLARCPYLQQVLASFNTVFGRSRLMRLGGQSQVPEHSDIGYHWYNRVRIHVPIITNPDIRFYCNDKDVHMAAGEAWIFDSWKMHKVVNPTHQTRVHLVADTAGSAAFWDLVARSERPFDPVNSRSTEPRLISYQPGLQVKLLTEKYTHSVIMPPGEMDALTVDLLMDIRRREEVDPAARDAFIDVVERLRHDWRSTWTLVGAERTEWTRYENLLQEARRRIAQINRPMSLFSNSASAVDVFMNRILVAAFNPAVAADPADDNSAPSGKAGVVQRIASSGTSPAEVAGKTRKVGRNEACPCGSGRKYKYCHG